MTGDVPVSRQIACLERELRMRRTVYPKMIERNRMTQIEADREIAEMKAALGTLRQVGRVPVQRELLAEDR